jgi:hypothetical protein
VVRIWGRVLLCRTLVINHQPNQEGYDILPGRPFGEELCQCVLQLPWGCPGLPSRRRLDLLRQDVRRVSESGSHIKVNNAKQNFLPRERRKWGILWLLTYT